MPTHSRRRQQDATGSGEHRERERPPLSGGLPSYSTWEGSMSQSGRRKERSRNRPTDGVGDSGWDWEDGQQVLSPFLPPSSAAASGLHPSYGAVTSARTLARIMEAERERESGERRGSGPLGWGATYVSHNTPHFPASSVFRHCFYMAPFLD